MKRWMGLTAAMLLTMTMLMGGCKSVQPFHDEVTTDPTSSQETTDPTDAIVNDPAQSGDACVVVTSVTVTEPITVGTTVDVDVAAGKDMAKLTSIAIAMHYDTAVWKVASITDKKSEDFDMALVNDRDGYVKCDAIHMTGVDLKQGDAFFTVTLEAIADVTQDSELTLTDEEISLNSELVVTTVQNGIIDVQP